MKQQRYPQAAENGPEAADRERKRALARELNEAAQGALSAARELRAARAEAAATFGVDVAAAAAAAVDVIDAHVTGRLKEMGEQLAVITALRDQFLARLMELAETELDEKGMEAFMTDAVLRAVRDPAFIARVVDAIAEEIDADPLAVRARRRCAGSARCWWRQPRRCARSARPAAIRGSWSTGHNGPPGAGRGPSPNQGKGKPQLRRQVERRAQCILNSALRSLSVPRAAPPTRGFGAVAGGRRAPPGYRRVPGGARPPGPLHRARRPRPPSGRPKGRERATASADVPVVFRYRAA